MGETGAIVVHPIGWVKNERRDRRNDQWGGVVSTVLLDPAQFDVRVVRGLEDFSHLEVLFHFDRNPPEEECRSTCHPRDNPAWPPVGIFAQRASARPNRLGVTRCHLLQVDGLRLTVECLDALDGTPVLDIKPYLEEFGPRGPVRQPRWTRELMQGYYG